MDRAYKSICGVRGSVTRNLNHIVHAISEEAGAQYIESESLVLNERWSKYEERWDDFAEEYDEEENFKDMEGKHFKLEDEYRKVQIALSKYIKDEKSKVVTSLSPSPTSPSHSNTVFKTKLPDIRLSEFHGNPLDWIKFWNQFSSLVDSKSDLDDVTKYTYLTQCVKGSAKEVLAGFRGEPSDYHDAVQALKQLYGDKNKVKRLLIRKLIKIETPKFTRTEILSFKLELENLLMQIGHNPDVNVDESEWLIAELITMKLPKEADDFFFNLFKTMYYNLTQLKNGLQKLVDYMETKEEIRVASNCQSKSNNTKLSSGNVSQQECMSKIQHSNGNPTAIGTYSTTTSYSNCFFCSKGHKTYDCSEYSTISARKERLKAMNRCVKCVKTHDTNECSTVLNMCPHCKRGKHHSFLCIGVNSQLRDNKPNTANVASSVIAQPNHSLNTKGYVKFKPKGDVKNQPSNSSRFQGDPIATTQVLSIMASRKSNVNYSVALPTATVSVRSENGLSVQTRCFFDSGSQRSFIHRDLANQLGLKKISEMEMTLDSFDSNGQQNVYEIVRPTLSLGGRKKRVVMAVVKRMPQQIITPGLHATALNLNQLGYKLADKQINSDNVENIQILIGSDFFGRYMSGMTNVGGIDLLESPGGHLIYGIIPNYTNSNPVTCTSTLVANVITRPTTISSMMTEPRLINSCVIDGSLPVHKLWDLDVVGINPVQESPNDVKSLSHYESTVKYDAGRYWVELPFRVNHPCLPNNYKLALGRMCSQRKKFLDKPELLAYYNGMIQEQLHLGFIEEVVNPVVGPSTHYLPHHAVAKQSVTTPLRIVYDCSAKINKTSVSLNDCLMTGPSLTEKLSDVLVKFRTKQFAYVADIRKAFLQVGLQSHHRDFTRFLWPTNPFDENSDIKTYRFKAVLFGATCSPFLLQMTLNYHFCHSESPYADVLASSFYVDNLQGSTDDETELIDIYTEANKELDRAGMTLDQWNSNSALLRTHITQDKDSESDFDSVNNVLGLDWDILNDTLSLKSCHFEQLEYVTKRQLLSLVSTCFDPLGMCSPILIKGKLLIQSAWKEQVGWDVHLSPMYLSKWKDLAREINELPTFKFQRCVCVTGDRYTLHVFVDASTSAYGAVCYLTNECTGNSFFVGSKARVAPLKGTTLPRLELTAIQLGAQYASYLQSLLKEFDLSQIIIWSDSEVALQWLRNGNSKMVYVQNRVTTIHEIGATFQFLYVPTKENPADFVTRGITVKQFRTACVWMAGPLWLSSVDSWPVQKPNVVVYEIVSEIIPKLPMSKPIFDYIEYTSIVKLLTVTMYVFKFIQIKFPNVRLSEPITYWMRQVQKEHYPSIYGKLKNQPVNIDKESKQLVEDLGLYFDESSGLVRSRGRLHHSSLDHRTKFPILIPTKCHLAYLLIIFAHEKCLHGGTQETLLLIRKHYWMPKCRQTIKSIIRRCVVCKRVEGKKFCYPGPPPLPAERVQLSRPFAHVGIDYSGPITLTKTEDNRLHKYYICLFTCTATRLVHLELACDMSASTFVNLFRRFCAAYSPPDTVISDNGSNFLASAKFFEELMSHPLVIHHMNSNHIKWKFIAPRAPWQGGFYERLIGLTKSCLKKVLFRKKVNRDELETILKEIQSRVNNRPLTYVNEEDPVEPLTPAHLLYGRTVTPIPPLVMEDSMDPEYLGHEELNVKYSHLSSIINRFEALWRNDYLTSLREKHYGANKAVQHNPPQIGDIVIIERPGPQHEWPLARIVEIHPDAENNIRSVEVLCNGVISKRTLDKLVPLEINQSEVKPIESETGVHNPVDYQQVRPRRLAAERAARFRQELIANEQL